MNITRLTDDLSNTIGQGWKIIEIGYNNLIIEVPNEVFIEKVSKLMKENYSSVSYVVKIINHHTIHRPKQYRPNTKLKVIAYLRTEKRIKNYDRHDDFYYLETFVFDDGSVWDRQEGKWKLIYQPEDN